MSRLIRIASWKGRSRASVIFVHGLGGHAYKTWRRGEDDDTFWPIWLAEDVEGAKVYSLAYEAPVSNWLGTSMPLQDRAVNILELLLTEPNLRTGPIVFVCHSLGGLVLKKILLNLQQQATRRPEAGDLLERVLAIVFAATPHTGARHATWLDRLSFLAWPSTVTRTLVANDPGLRDINVAYRGLADDRRKTLQHLVFYETLGTPGGVIVDEASADPGLPGDPPVPIDADHISIVKPPDRSSLLYARVKQFVERIPAFADRGDELELFALPVIRSDRPLNVVPKLVRIAALLLVGLIGFKGVQALVSPSVDLTKLQQPFLDQMAEKDKQISKLLALLDEKRTTPAPPGAEQELKKAVVAINEGATSDSRYAQALDFLKAGKPAQAEPLLKIVAEDKVRNAVDANREAAAAYRNLASIAAVSDPGRAREYYARAAELDPNNVEGLAWNGLYQREAGHLDTAQTAFEHVLSRAGTLDAHWAIQAHIGLGNIRIDRGNLSDALNSYRDGFAIADRLAKSDPANAGWQRDLSISFNKIGDMQKAQGDLSAALKSYSDGLTIRDRLAKSDPANAGWQRDLMVSFNKIGDMQVAQGDLSAALRSYSDGLAIADKLAKSDPANAGWRRDLMVSFNKIGDVQVAQGDLLGALKSYRDGLTIRDRLTKSDPANADWQRDLSLSFDRLGNVQVAQGDLSAALRSYSDGLAVRDRLAKSNPSNAGWQRDLSISFSKVAEVLKGQNNIQGTRDSLTQARDIMSHLTKLSPENATWKRELGRLEIELNELPR